MKDNNPPEPYYGLENLAMQVYYSDYSLDEDWPCNLGIDHRGIIKSIISQRIKTIINNLDKSASVDDGDTTREINLTKDNLVKFLVLEEMFSNNSISTLDKIWEPIKNYRDKCKKKNIIPWLAYVVNTDHMASIVYRDVVGTLENLIRHGLVSKITVPNDKTSHYIISDEKFLDEYETISRWAVANALNDIYNHPEYVKASAEYDAKKVKAMFEQFQVDSEHDSNTDAMVSNIKFILDAAGIDATNEIITKENLLYLIIMEFLYYKALCETYENEPMEECYTVVSEVEKDKIWEALSLIKNGCNKIDAHRKLIQEINCDDLENALTLLVSKGLVKYDGPNDKLFPNCYRIRGYYVEEEGSIENNKKFYSAYSQHRPQLELFPTPKQFELINQLRIKLQERTKLMQNKIQKKYKARKSVSELNVTNSISKQQNQKVA